MGKFCINIKSIINGIHQHSMKVKVIRNYQITIPAKIRKKLNMGEYLIIEEDEK